MTIRSPEAAPLQAGFAEAGEAQLLGVADADGNLDRDALAVGHAALARRIRGRGCRWSCPVPLQLLHVVAVCMSPKNVC